MIMLNPVVIIVAATFNDFKNNLKLKLINVIEESTHMGVSEGYRIATEPG